MTANTSYKLVDHLAVQKANQYDFTFPAGWQPMYESQTPEIAFGDRGNYPYKNLSWYTDYGISQKTINLQGENITLNDRYVLQSAMSNPRLKKLYLGEDWYYYVRGIPPLTSRSENIPTIHNYTASFLALDPCMYFGGAEANDYPAGTAGFGYGSCATGAMTLDLTSKGTWFVEPAFWVSGESGNTITFTDERGVSLAFTPSDAGLFIVLPYYRYNKKSTTADGPAIVNPGSWTLANFDDAFAMDSSQEAVSPELVKSNLSATLGNTGGFIDSYPQFTWNKSSTITATGMSSSDNIKFQYRYRRL
mgnify:CR=1 FL=1